MQSFLQELNSGRQDDLPHLALSRGGRASLSHHRHRERRQDRADRAPRTSSSLGPAASKRPICAPRQPAGNPCACGARTMTMIEDCAPSRSASTGSACTALSGAKRHRRDAPSNPDGAGAMDFGADLHLRVRLCARQSHAAHRGKAPLSRLPHARNRHAGRRHRRVHPGFGRSLFRALPALHPGDADLAALLFRDDGRALLPWPSSAPSSPRSGSF